MNNYIFLDIDGVLNDKNTRAQAPYHCTGIGKKHLDILKKIVDATQGKIVLISDWRLSFFPEDHMPDMAKYILKTLHKYDLDFELVSDVHKYRMRDSDIREWIMTHPTKGFIIIDDDEYPGYNDADLQPHWIQTDPDQGLLETHYQEAVSKMKMSVSTNTKSEQCT